jgi:hypothetical protein
MILIGEATAEAVRVAVLRQRCYRVANGLPPYADSSAEARQAARSLSRTLDLLAVLRSTRRAGEVRRLEEQAGRLEARLAGLTGRLAERGQQASATRRAVASREGVVTAALARRAPGVPRR